MTIPRRSTQPKIVQENMDDGDNTTPHLIISADSMEEINNRSELSPRAGSVREGDDSSSCMSNATDNSRRAHRIANILQQEGKMDVTLDEDFLNRLGSMKGNSIAQIRTSLINAQDSVPQGFEGLDAKSMENWEKSLNKSSTFKQRDSSHNESSNAGVGHCITCGMSKYSKDRLQKEIKSYKSKFVSLK